MTQPTSNMPGLTTSTGEPRITENMNTAGLDTAHLARPAAEPGAGAGSASLLRHRGVQLALASLLGLLLGRAFSSRDGA